MNKKSEGYEVGSDNIFADLKLPNADELMAKAKLLHSVSSLIKTSKLTQQEVAKKLGITQPKVSILVSGRLSAFSTETLLHYLYILGCDVQIRVKKPRSRVGIFRDVGHFAVCSKV